MRIAGTLRVSANNGEGIRYVVFLQGCDHRCVGCHNPHTWDFEGGKEMSVEELAEDILLMRDFIDGVTLSGGDPFYQQDECVRLLELIPGVNTWVYTGFMYEDIKDTKLAKMVDAIVDGPFIWDLRCEGQYYGSSNQRIIRLGGHESDST